MLPVMMIAFISCFLDRTNVGFAIPSMGMLYGSQPILWSIATELPPSEVAGTLTGTINGVSVIGALCRRLGAFVDDPILVRSAGDGRVPRRNERATDVDQRGKQTTSDQALRDCLIACGAQQPITRLYVRDWVRQIGFEFRCAGVTTSTWYPAHRCGRYGANAFTAPLIVRRLTT